MSEKNMINMLRGFHFILGVLENQQKDLLCGGCLSFAKTLDSTRENFKNFEESCTGEGRQLSGIFCEIFADAQRKLSSIEVPGKPAGQKGKDNCKLPEDTCFIKATYAIYEKIVM